MDEYDTPMAPVCDGCGATDVDLTGCGECEMRYCDECSTNFVTDAGCPMCIKLPPVLLDRLEEMLREMQGAA